MDDCNILGKLAGTEEIDGSDSSMDDCNKFELQIINSDFMFRFLYGRL